MSDRMHRSRSIVYLHIVAAVRHSHSLSVGQENPRIAPGYDRWKNIRGQPGLEVSPKQNVSPIMTQRSFALLRSLRGYEWGTVTPEQRGGESSVRQVQLDSGTSRSACKPRRARTRARTTYCCVETNALNFTEMDQPTWSEGRERKRVLWVESTIHKKKGKKQKTMRTRSK